MGSVRAPGYAGWRTCVDPRGQEALTRYEAVAAYKYSEGHGKTQRYTWPGPVPGSCFGFDHRFSVV